MSSGFWWYGGAAEAQLLAATGQIIAVAQVIETDLAQAITWAPKNRLVGQITETDLAQAIGRLKIKALGQVAEIDLAQAVSWAPKNRLVAQAVETDFALTITPFTSGGIVSLLPRERRPYGRPRSHRTAI